MSSEHFLWSNKGFEVFANLGLDPLLWITAFECISDNPLDLIKAIKIAATNFKEIHKNCNPKCVYVCLASGNG